MIETDGTPKPLMTVEAKSFLRQEQRANRERVVSKTGSEIAEQHLKNQLGRRLDLNLRRQVVA